jgi:DNA polymerase-3 subunit epsilon
VAFPETFVLIDVETTGANPVSDRVTEVAVLRVERGEIVERWESLVNPQCSIPGMIQRLIGITDAMVATAPTFAELADRLRTRLDGAVFIAHNARFDYGFIKNEYSRIGQGFDAPVLCTVKLSRALTPVARRPRPAGRPLRDAQHRRSHSPGRPRLPA